MPDEVKAALTEIEITNQKSIGKSLKDISLPPRTLVMMIRREGHYIVPNGKTTIQQGDRLLLISEDAGQQQPTPIKSKGRFVLVESVKNFIENATKK